MAHEIGHLLGMDQTMPGDDCYGGIMSDGGAPSGSSTIWSKCSVKDFKEAFHKHKFGRTGCLEILEK